MATASSSPERRNPFYILLLISSFLFVLTALACALVPTLEQKAIDAGQPPPPSAFRDALRRDGWQWLLYEVAAVVLFGLLSMFLDRLRRLQNERAAAKISSAEQRPQSG
jgi:hypothetical protein